MIHREIRGLETIQKNRELQTRELHGPPVASHFFHRPTIRDNCERAYIQYKEPEWRVEILTRRRRPLVA